MQGGRSGSVAREHTTITLIFECPSRPLRPFLLPTQSQRTALSCGRNNEDKRHERAATPPPSRWTSGLVFLRPGFLPQQKKGHQTTSPMLAVDRWSRRGPSYVDIILINHTQSVFEAFYDNRGGSFPLKGFLNGGAPEPIIVGRPNKSSSEKWLSLCLGHVGAFIGTRCAFWWNQFSDGLLLVGSSSSEEPPIKMVHLYCYMRRLHSLSLSRCRGGRVGKSPEGVSYLATRVLRQGILTWYAESR